VPISGGYFVYLRLPHGISADELTKRAQTTQNVIVTPESMCRVPHKDINGHVVVQADHDEFIRLCFAWEEESSLTEGVDRLGKLLKDMLSGTENTKDHIPVGSLNQYS
jgi:DNA-binding transcriptional MocR family regulator